MDDAEQVLRLQLLATVTRVSSTVAGYFGRVTRDEDAFPVDATVQSAWRELQGGVDESQRRGRWRASLVRLESAAPLPPVDVADAVPEALAAVRLVTDSWASPADAAMAAALRAHRVATSFDAAGLPAPSGQETWVSYEQSCIESIAPTIRSGDVFMVRLESGMQSMSYRQAMLESAGRAVGGTS